MVDQPGRADFSRLYRTILDELGTGQYRAGQRLGVKEMADRLHVSPTPIRELMSRLVGRGVIEERRSEGYYLARLEVRDIADLYRLHGQCTDLAIRELTWPPALPVTMPQDGWSIISCLVDQTGNLILRDARAYLGDRLRVIRHFEDLAIDGIAAESRDLARLCTSPARAVLRRAIARFYKRRIAAAPGLALLLGRA